MAIDKLTATDAIVGGDQIAVGKTSAGDDRRAAATVLLAYMQASLTFPTATEFTTQYAAPSATGFNVAITDDSDNIWLVITPVAGYAAGTITLPAVANAADKQEILINCTQAVTTLTIDGNGAAAVTGEPTGLSADDFFKLRFDFPTKTWYRIG